MVLIRGVLTVGAQAAMVLALSYNQPILAWPILNSAALLSVVLSSIVLREHPTKAQSFAVVTIAILGLVVAGTFS
jgi:drug/metabolite transporter (DMT)-like permease